MFTQGELATIASALGYTADHESAAGRFYTAAANYKIAIKSAKLVSGWSNGFVVKSLKDRAARNEAKMGV